ncbi:holliday junction resolvase [Choristoneura biennis entomopoxvirus]|uniref:Holliday junction resolvase n=1 Tax=Choristoneura biennis entomopoxvirus TaxID=10288 RepID=A0A916KPN9_CBEPV|nr:holliday junction resolvase [Choristoneura biennis entomopoxvirus]CCU55772.1 holliday junction resolvase [Choristoneura biennis entomopoxvirus]
MIILSIDVGVKNLGMSMIGLIDNKCNIICIKENLSNIPYNKLYDKLNKIYNKYHMHNVDNVIIEQQFRGRRNIFYYGFIYSFFQGKNKLVQAVKPYTYSMRIKTYRLRKFHTINIFKNLMRENDTFILSDYTKYDDIADATCLALKWLKVNVNDIIIESIQII